MSTEGFDNGEYWNLVGPRESMMKVIQQERYIAINIERDLKTDGVSIRYRKLMGTIELPLSELRIAPFLKLKIAQRAQR